MENPAFFNPGKDFWGTNEGVLNALDKVEKPNNDWIADVMNSDDQDVMNNNINEQIYGYKSVKIFFIALTAFISFVFFCAMCLIKENLHNRFIYANGFILFLFIAILCGALGITIIDTTIKNGEILEENKVDYNKDMIISYVFFGLSLLCLFVCIGFLKSNIGDLDKIKIHLIIFICCYSILSLATLIYAIISGNNSKIEDDE